MSAVLVFFAALAVPPVAGTASAECAVSWYVPYLVTPARHTLSPDGALLIGLRLEWGSADDRPETAVDFPPMTLARGRTQIPMRIEVLTGTLARYVPEQAPAAGRYEVEGLTNTEVRFGTEAAEPLLLAPEARVVDRYTEDRRGGTVLRATLGSLPPSRAHILLLRRGRSGFGWKVLDRGDVVQMIPTPNGCQALPRANTLVPRVGAEVILRYIDANGRLGPRSTIVMTSW